MHIKIIILILFLLAIQMVACTQQVEIEKESNDPFLVVLGIAQDGGIPQAGNKDHRGWQDPQFRHHVVCLGIVDPITSERWLIDATPDFKEQLHLLDTIFPVDQTPGLTGIFLSHAHIGHYTGLMFLGLEVMGARQVPVYAMPRMKDFLSENGPWDQLVRYENILLKQMTDGTKIRLNSRLAITPFVVPHRQEYSEVVGFHIDGPKCSALYITDIDKWEDWDAQGTLIESLIAQVDMAFLDGTFYADGEIPGRDMSGFPHPFIKNSMERFQTLSAEDRNKIYFIHFNHTNPALLKGGEARKTIEEKGFHVAEEMQRLVM